MKIKSIESINNNDLSELAGLVATIKRLIERDYLHVSESLPPSYISGTNKLLEQVYKEQEKREDEEYY
jgi:hypothetical protein